MRTILGPHGDARPPRRRRRPRLRPRAIAGLLELLAAVPRAAATNEANRAAQPLVRPPSVPGTEVHTGSESPVEVGPSDTGAAGRPEPDATLPASMPADPTPTATNEANRPTEEPARPVRRLTVGVLALIAFLVGAGLTAAFAAPAAAVGREASPRNDRDTEDNPQGPDREGLMRSAPHTATHVVPAPTNGAEHLCASPPLS